MIFVLYIITFYSYLISIKTVVDRKISFKYKSKFHWITDDIDYQNKRYENKNSTKKGN